MSHDDGVRSAVSAVLACGFIWDDSPQKREFWRPIYTWFDPEERALGVGDTNDDEYEGSMRTLHGLLAQLKNPLVVEELLFQYIDLLLRQGFQP